MMRKSTWLLTLKASEKLFFMSYNFAWFSENPEHILCKHISNASANVFKILSINIYVWYLELSN